MLHKELKSNRNRTLSFETFESRLVLSANSLIPIDAALSEASLVTNTAAFTTQTTGGQFQEITHIQQQYGFDGAGQTVAIIDTGIAWDHVALGGGFGAGYKVVGGWDFAENDTNPYDDGPFGFHGTHVAGIVGNADPQYHGVAQGVDLVALRVFDDNGTSKFDWVEQALQWVHTHRNDFANPITTVNLSLGDGQNLTSSTPFSSLQDEFAQLDADGIFISVAAGNSFQEYLTPGLSYPANSPDVVPVASHDAHGQMSDFSQRDWRVLVAPGEGIESTVPDHLFAGTQTNQFMSGSGTSMATPYVSGASALLRER